LNYILKKKAFTSIDFGRVRLELNGYQYRDKNNRGDRRYWEGIVPLCPATISTHWETITKSGNYHTHVPNSARVKFEAVINIIKGRCIKETTPIPTKLKKYTTVTSNYSKPLVNNINFS
jgi:hypothetical protein